MELTILMPCLNEAETLAICIRKARGFLAQHGVDGEVLIADNGSTDGSQQIATDEGARVIHASQRGYGAALTAGIEAANGRYIIMGDADDSYDFSALAPFLEQLREGYHLVMGNRFAGGLAPGAMPPLHRYLGNPVLSGIGRTLFPRPVHDFHCGLRGFDTQVIRELGLRTTGMEFASEMVVRATLHGLRITEVPTTLSRDGRSRPPHLRSWRDGWRHLRFLLVYSPRWLFTYPGLLLLAVGLTGVIALTLTDVSIGAVTLGVNTLLYAALATVLGFEALSFSRILQHVGARAGELGRESRLKRLFSWLTLERSIVIGCALIAAGVGGSVYSLSVWSAADFGDLMPQALMRVVIPSVTSVIVGAQFVLSGFVMYALENGPASKLR